MSRGRYIGKARRAAIFALRKKVIVLREIAHQLNFLEHALHNVLAYFKKNGRTDVAKSKRRQRKTSIYVERMIHGLSEANRLMRVTDKLKELNDKPGFNVTPRTVQRRLNEFGLMGRVVRKKPLLSKRNITARLNFAKEHVDWKAEEVQ